MGSISLRSEPPTVILSGEHEIEDPFLHGFLQQQGKARYEEAFQRALRIGARAMLDDRIGTVLARVEADLDAQLTSLHHLLRIADMNQRAAKGQVAEDAVSRVLSDLIDDRSWGDALRETGSSVGAIPRSKVGDLVVQLEERVNLVIEVKMQKRYELGAPTDYDGRSKSKAAKDTVYGQLLVARENRQAAFGIFVVDEDETAASVTALQSIHLLPEVPGLLVKVAPEKGRWENLIVAYQLARQLTLLPMVEDRVPAVQFLLARIVRDLRHLDGLRADLAKVRTAAQQILDTAVAAESRLDVTTQSLDATHVQVERLLAGESLAPAQLMELLADSEPS
jgi:hypothetical protein